MCTFHIETEDRDLERLRHEAERDMADRGHGEDKKETQTMTEKHDNYSPTWQQAQAHSNGSHQSLRPSGYQALNTRLKNIPSRKALLSHFTVRNSRLRKISSMFERKLQEG